VAHGGNFDPERIKLMDNVYAAREKAEVALQPATEREPTESDWGFCAYGDAPEAIGGGMAVFVWFESREEMLASIAEHALFLNLPRHDLDLDAIQEGVRSTVEAMRHSRIDDAAGMSELNKLLRHASQLTWLGKFSSLRRGETEADRDVLRQFRESEDGAAAGPVSDEELGGFREFLMSYCTA